MPTARNAPSRGHKHGGKPDSSALVSSTWRSGTAGLNNRVTVISRYWAESVKAAGVRHIKLHGGRHTAATLMHLDGVPVAVIAAWIGHSDPTLTLRVYAHSQDDALKMAGSSLDRPNKSSG